LAGSDLSVYLHLPVCPSRCDYCDFYSERLTPEERDATGAALVDRILADTEAWLESPYLEHLGGVQVKTVYLGGGSPTYLRAETLGRLLSGLERRLPCVPGAEWSVESHPADLTPEIVEMLEGSAVNRLSLGVQSFDGETLSLIGRRDPEASDPAVLGRVLRCWSGTISVDLIGERPGQSAGGLREDLETAVGLGARHLSVYPLSWPPSSPSSGPDPRERLGYPDFDAWEVTERTLGDAGFLRYEVSNFAQPGFECRHSIAYWRMAPYLGIGPGAVGTLPYPPETRGDERWTLRTTGLQPIAAFLGATVAPAVHLETQTKKEALFERHMMGLRLAEGLSLGEIGREFGEDAVERVLAVAGPSLDRGLLELLVDSAGSDRRLRCLPEGRLRLDEVLRELINIIE
jgi:oxygen-independent coproporphyrinogen III oxidase